MCSIGSTPRDGRIAIFAAVDFRACACAIELNVERVIRALIESERLSEADALQDRVESAIARVSPGDAAMATRSSLPLVPEDRERIRLRPANYFYKLAAAHLRAQVRDITKARPKASAAARLGACSMADRKGSPLRQRLHLSGCPNLEVKRPHCLEGYLLFIGCTKIRVIECHSQCFQLRNQVACFCLC